jgi:hypothetical protein
VKFVFLRRAEREAIAIQKRWQRDADDKETFAKDLIEAETHLTTLPDSGAPWKVQRGKVIRRWLLEKSKCHLYYRFESKQEAVIVMAVWDGRRRHPPRL